jgi:hypothetical protein
MKWNKFLKITFALLLFTAAADSALASLADFDDLTLDTDSYWNGADGTGGFPSGAVTFNNNFTDWGDGITSWDGFAYSNRTNTTLQGLSSQYNVISGSGQGGSVNYGIGFVGWTEFPTITLNTARIIDGLYVNNNNYAYYTMLYGDSSFGVDPFAAGDWFTLTITGKDAAGVVTGSVDFYLADFRDGKSEIVNIWHYVDLTGLGMVKSLEFSMDSSDYSYGYMNTPGYFAIDTLVPEPISLVLLGLGGLWIRRTRA